MPSKAVAFVVATLLLVVLICSPSAKFDVYALKKEQCGRLRASFSAPGL
jgi:hypothetical protein